MLWIINKLFPNPILIRCSVKREKKDDYYYVVFRYRFGSWEFVRHYTEN